MPSTPEATAAQQPGTGRQCERLSALAVVTGTTHGIGRITSRELARAGYDVAMLCRDPAAAAAVRTEIAAAVPGATINIISCDLASFASVRACARELRGGFGGVSGAYFDEHQQQVAAAAVADDRTLQEALWLASERWTRAVAESGRSEAATALPSSMRS